MDLLQLLVVQTDTKLVSSAIHIWKEHKELGIEGADCTGHNRIWNTLQMSYIN